MSSLDSLVQTAANAMPATTTTYGITSMEQFAPAPKEGVDILGFNVPTWVAVAAGLTIAGGGLYMGYNYVKGKSRINEVLSMSDTAQKHNVGADAVAVLMHLHKTLSARKKEIEDSYLPKMFFGDYDEVSSKHAELTAKLKNIKANADVGGLGSKSAEIKALMEANGY